MNNRELILKCMDVNQRYMRLPAGKVAGLETMTALYKRIASQLLDCAQAWVQDRACPDHEPATDAFIWAIVAWSDAFGLSMGVDMAEWSRLFVYPHDQFAYYLRPGNPPPPLEPVEGSPTNIIMELDSKWMEMVIKLTAEYGLLHHFKDRQARSEARQLDTELRKPESPARKAYLESDLAFLHALLEPFPFSQKTRQYIADWLTRAEEGL